MILRNLLQLGALLLLMAVGSSSAPAQTMIPFSIVFHDTSVSIPPYSVKDLKADVTNTTDAPIEIRLIRVENNLPNAFWFSALCWGDYCYDTSNSNPDPATLDPGETVEFKLTIGTIDSFPDPGDMARVVVQFDTGMFSEAIVQEFRVGITPSGIAVERGLPGRPAWPNPARERLTIPLPNDVASSDAQVSLVDNTGRVVASAVGVRTKEGVIVDVSAVPVGTYRYRLIAGERAWSAPVVVVR